MCKWRERDWDKEEENNWGKEEKKSLGGGRKNSWVPAVPKSMDMEGVGFLEIVMKETANQAEHPAFLPESRLAFFFSQEEEFTLSYGSASPLPPLLPDSQSPWCNCQGGEMLQVTLARLSIADRHCHCLAWCWNAGPLLIPPQLSFEEVSDMPGRSKTQQ